MENATAQTDGSVQGATESIAAILNPPTEAVTEEPKEQEAGQEPDPPETAEAAQEAEAVEATEDSGPDGAVSDSEQSAEAEAEAAEDSSDATDERSAFTVLIDGEEKQFSESEIVTALREKNTARQEQGLYEQRLQDLEAKGSEIEQVRQNYRAALEQANALLGGETERPRLADFSGDYEAHALAMEEWENDQAMRAALRQEYEHEQQRQSELQQQAFTDFERREAALLKQKAPHLASAEAINGLREWAVKEWGFEPAQLQQAVDHRYTQLLHYAKKGWEAEKAIPKVRQKLKEKPKVVTSGSPPSKQEQVQEGVANSVNRLKQTGSIDDAAAVVAQMLE